MRGFITFEGGDGAGKSTLIDKVFQFLLQKGVPVIKTRAPGGSRVGEAIRELLLHKLPMSSRCELFLFLADRAEHVDSVLQPALDQKKIVLCDRYNDSTLAYQAGARGLPLDQVHSLCAFASHHLQPDLTFYLDIDPTIALQRLSLSKDRMENESIDFHQKIREAFHQIAKDNPTRIRLLDATLSPDQLFKQAMEYINVFL